MDSSGSAFREDLAIEGITEKDYLRTRSGEVSLYSRETCKRVQSVG